MTADVSRWLATWPFPLTEEAALEKIRGLREQVSSGDAFHFVLRPIEGRAFVGCTSVWQTEAKDEWQLGFWMSEAWQGQGYGSEAASTVSNHLVRSERPRSLSAIVLPDNARSISILRKLGMSRTSETHRVVTPNGREQLFLVFRRMLES